MSNCHLALTDSLKFSVVNRVKNRATFPLQSTPESRAKLSRNATRTNRCTHLETGVMAYSSAETCLRRSEEHTSELQSRLHLVCRLLLEKKKTSEYNTDCAYVRQEEHSLA